MVQLSNPYMATGKTITWTRQTFAGKVISVLFNMLSRLVITFLPRSQRLVCSQHVQWLPFILFSKLHNHTLTLRRQVHHPVHVWNYAVAQNTFSFPSTFLSFTHPQSHHSNFHLLLQPHTNTQTPVFLPKQFLPLHSPSPRYKPLTA